MKISVFGNVQPVASVVQVGAIHLLQMCMHLLGNCKILKDRHGDRPAKNHATTYHIHVLPLLDCHG